MNKSQQHMEQMAALVMLAFTIVFLTGEAVRDELYGTPNTMWIDSEQPQAATDTPQSQHRRK